MNDRARQFETVALPHLDAAYNLARWLLHDEHAANDAVQDAYLRALRYFGSFHGDDAKPWLLGIVRNTCFTWLRDNRGMAQAFEFDEERDSDAGGDGRDTDGTGLEGGPRRDDPEALLSAKQDGARIDAAIAQLPPAFREVIVLRELEEMAYGDIARIAGVPVGTVMSRLSRGRALLRRALAPEAKGRCDEH